MYIAFKNRLVIDKWFRENSVFDNLYSLQWKSKKFTNCNTIVSNFELYNDLMKTILYFMSYVSSQSWRAFHGDSPSDNWVPRVRNGLCPLAGSTDRVVLCTQDAGSHLAFWKIQGIYIHTF